MQVVFSLVLSCPAYDGAPGTGKQLASVSADTPCRVQLGTGALPEGLEAALCSMSKGEQSLFVIPAADMQPPTASSSSSSKPPQGLRIPALPAKCVQVEAVVELLDLVQVCGHTVNRAHSSYWLRLSWLAGFKCSIGVCANHVPLCC
jgi:hypothetical protein